MAKVKAAGKSASAKTGAGKASQTTKTTWKTRTTAERAAAVEANTGGSQPLRDFLKKAGWY